MPSASGRRCGAARQGWVTIARPGRAGDPTRQSEGSPRGCAAPPAAPPPARFLAAKLTPTLLRLLSPAGGRGPDPLSSSPATGCAQKSSHQITATTRCGRLRLSTTKTLLGGSSHRAAGRSRHARTRTREIHNASTATTACTHRSIPHHPTPASSTNPLPRRRPSSSPLASPIVETDNSVCAVFYSDRPVASS